MHGAPWLPIVHDLPARLPVLAVPVHRDRYLRGPRRRPDRSHIRRGQAERRVDTLQSPGMQRGPAALALGRLVLAILPIGAIMCRGRSLEVVKKIITTSDNIRCAVPLDALH